MLKRTLLGLLLLYWVSLSAAETVAEPVLRIDPIHPVLRPGLVHRFRIHMPPTTGINQTIQAQLVCAVMAGDRPLLQRDLGQVNARDLQQGMIVNWVVPAEYDPGPIRITASWLHGNLPLNAERGVFDIVTLGNDLSELAQRLDLLGRDGIDPLPHLWLEQAALEIRAPGDLFAADLISQKRAEIANWLNGQNQQPTSGELAYRCRLDGSLQPYRWYPSRSPVSAGVVLLLGEGFGLQPDTAMSKSRWAAPPPEMLKAMAQAGFHVLQIYPAGDLSWEGIGLARIQQVTDNLQQRQLLPEGLPWYGLGRANGAGGILRFALENPHQFKGIILENGRLDTRPTVAEPQGVDEALWFNRSRQLALRGAHLVQTDLRIIGDIGAELNWLRAYEPTYFNAAQLHELSWWRSVADGSFDKAPVLPEYIALKPGPIGPFVIHELPKPWSPARIRFDAVTQAFRLSNINGLSWRPQRALPGVSLPQFVNGTDKPVDVAPLDVGAYATGPFVLVVGTGEHAESQLQNVKGAQAFMRRWVLHGQGAPPVIFDHDFDPNRYRSHHWILFGGPRSNAQAALLATRLADPWPVQSDGRHMTIDGQRFLRSEGLGVVYAVRDPGRPNFVTVVADGDEVRDGAVFPWYGMGRILWQSGDQAPRFKP